MPEKQKRVRKAKVEEVAVTNITLSYSRGETRSFDYNSSRYDVGLSLTLPPGSGTTEIDKAMIDLSSKVEEMLSDRMNPSAKTDKHECKGDCNQKIGKQEKVTPEKMGISEPGIQ